MDFLCIRCGSQDHTTREHEEGKCNNARGVQKGHELAHEQKSSLAKTCWPAATFRQEVCWQSVGKRPGIPEVNDKPLKEPWVQPKDLQPMICRDSKLCPCLSCECKRKKKRLERIQRMGKVR